MPERSWLNLGVELRLHPSPAERAEPRHWAFFVFSGCGGGGYSFILKASFLLPTHRSLSLKGILLGGDVVMLNNGHPSS